MKNFNLYLIHLLASGLWSCQEKAKSNSKNLPQQEEITRIEWSNYGGDLGFAETVVITKDSIIHTYFVAANNDNITTNKYKNKKEEWEKLTNAFVYSDFKKIKSGESNQPADGTDQKIHITTKNDSDSVINGYKDTKNYAKILNFIGLLDNIKIEKK